MQAFDLITGCNFLQGRGLKLSYCESAMWEYQLAANPGRSRLRIHFMSSSQEKEESYFNIYVDNELQGIALLSNCFSFEFIE